MGGSDDILITAIEIYAEMQMGSSDNINMYIYEDWYGGGLVGQLDPAAPITTAGNYTFVPTAPIVLTPLSVYSLIIEPDFVDGTWMEWHYSSTDTGSAYSQATGTTWGSWENGTSAPTYRIYGEVVPEPATAALFLLGASCLFARRKKKLTCPGVFRRSLNAGK